MKYAVPLLVTLSLLAAQPQPDPQLEETTIARVHAAMKSDRLTCVALVDYYLQRIEANDKRGPALNAITVVNPNARADAQELDRRYKASGPVGPLH